MQSRPRRLLLAALVPLLLMTACTGTAPVRPDIESIIDADAAAAPSYTEINFRAKPDPTVSQEFVTLVVPDATIQQAKDAIAEWSLASQREYTSVSVVRSPDSTDVVCLVETANTERVAKLMMRQSALVRWSCPDPTGS